MSKNIAKEVADILRQEEIEKVAKQLARTANDPNMKICSDFTFTPQSPPTRFDQPGVIYGKPCLNTPVAFKGKR